MRIRLSPAGVALVYAAIAGGWIVLSHLFLVVEADPARQGWIEIGKGLAFVVVTGALLYVLIRRRDAQLAREAAIRERLQAERLATQAESDRWLHHFFQLPFIGMAITEPETGRWIRFNDRLCEILGYPREEMEGLSWMAITHPDDLERDLGDLHRAKAGEIDGYQMEKRFVRKDGSVVYTELDVRVVRRPGGDPDYFVAMIEDITERTRDRERIGRQARFYAGLSACNAAVARCADAGELFDTACRLAVELAGFRLAWIGIVDAEGFVRVESRFGEGAEYLDGITISTDPALESGRGPTGIAIREDEPMWCDDFLADPRTAPWHERGRARGFGSSAAVPIRRGGRAIGAITLYAAHRHAFDAEARNLVADFAANLSFALDNFDREAARREAEDALKSSEARYRTAFLTNPDAMTISEIDGGRLVAVNDGFTSLFGWRAEEAVGRTADELGMWMDSVGRNRLVAEVMAFGKCREMELRLRARDGREILVLAVASALEVAGRPCMLAVTRDVTESRRAEQAVRKLSLAVEQSPESIVITNLAAEIEYVNRAFLEVTGYAPEDVLGKNPRILQSGRTPKATYDAMWAALAAGEVWKGELYNKRKDGTEYVEFAIIAPIRRPDGHVSHYLAVKDDITEKKRIGEELTAYRHHLEDLVRNRTEELAEARERAEAANAAKSAFLATMSHEIRTPMNAILGFASLLERDDPRPDQKARIAKLGVATRHLLALIDDILDLSKIEAGKLSIDRRVYDPGGLLAEAADMLRERAAAKGLELVSSRESGLPVGVIGDPLRVRQVLVNLGGNAVKFTERGRVDLRVAVVPGSGGAGALRFEVADTGIGIPADLQPRLFQRFEQADSSTTRRFGGTGLGLAVSKRLVDLMGGRIGFDSIEGRGSAFWFEIPLAVADGPVATPRAGAASDRKAPSLRILLVEDDAVNREIAADLLTHMGHRVHEAEDGAKAIEAAAGARFDLVLMDVQMPVLDGLDATRALRQMPAYHHTPVLAMTASVLDEDRRRCLDSGMSDVVTKPVDPAHLERTLARWAAAAPPGEGEPAAAAPDGEPELAKRLAAIEGLDAEAGLGRLRGQAGKYARLLRSFAARHEADARSLRASIAAREFDVAARLAHQVKGAAGMIGAMAVSEAAAALEAALTAGGARREDLQPLVDGFERSQRRLAEGLAGVIPEVDFADDVPVDPTRLAAVTEELVTLLDRSDIRAGSLLRKERPLLRSAYGNAVLEIETRLDAFDFGAALERLREIAANGSRPS